MKPLRQLDDQLASDSILSIIPEPTRPDIRRPAYAVYDQPIAINGKTFKAGVLYHGEKANSDGSMSPFDYWICSPLHIAAITSNDGGSFGRLLRFKNTTGQWREWSMPMHLLKGSGEELRGELLDMGVELDSKYRFHLNSYLQSQHPDRQATAATRIGWHSPDLFIMPRKNIGSGDAIYQSEDANSDDFTQGGTLDGWQNTIGAMCSGNLLLQLAIGSALAGTLLNFVNQSGGGFHIVGDSSTGKSTLIMAAASVWGHGEHFKRTWCATSNGLEGLAAQRNDTLLALDEIGESNPQEIGNIIYALANGAGKSRANRSGAARATRRWRVILLSSGEVGLSTLMAECGKKARAGQELRLLDVSSLRAHGCWDLLHQHPSGRHLSDHILKACTTHYGHLGPRFVSELIQRSESTNLLENLAKIREKFQCENGQEARAADRFALLALGLELARSWNLLPLNQWEGTKSMLALFADWKIQRGSGNSEDSKILRSIAEFVSRHGEAYFSNRLDSSGAPLIRDRAGWWDDTGSQRLWCFTSPGLKLAAEGYDINRIIVALKAANWIAASDSGKSSKNINVDGQSTRLYSLRIPEV